MCSITVATVRFGQSAYSIIEDNGMIQPILILSIPSSFDITIQVEDNPLNATGMNVYRLVNSTLTITLDL